MAKQKFYRLDRILSHKPNYAMLLGERSNGKSYSVKEYVLRRYLDHKEKFVYMRRYQIDVKTADVESYFADMPISAMTDGRYDGIIVYQGNIFFSKWDAEKFKNIRGEQIGTTVYLSGLEHFKSHAYPDYTTIIFEEFVTNKGYIPDEPNQLQHFISTIARRRRILVFMVGNTISRVNPYFEYFQLRNCPTMEQGQIDDYDFKTNQVDEETGEPVVVRVSVEFCANSGNNSKMFFGKVAEQITGGAWETHDHAHLEYDHDFYLKAYEVLLKYMGFQFVMELLVNEENGGSIVFVYPYTTSRPIERIITDQFSDNPFISKGLKQIRPELMMAECLAQNKVAYSDNLTGGDFEQILISYNAIFTPTL